MAIFRLLLVLWASLTAFGCATHQPAFQGDRVASLELTSAEGKPVTLAELSQHHLATVLVFWSPDCPCVRRYQERVDALLERYPTDRVRVVGISSNAGEPFADVLRVAKDRGVKIPIFRDEGGSVSAAVGARTTPTVAVIDNRGQIRFLGWIDNERLPGDPDREPWLDRALRGVLEDRADFAVRSPTYGCPITRSFFGRSSSPCCTHHSLATREPP